MSDSTICAEMSVFEAVMEFAVRRKYIAALQAFGAKPKTVPRQRDAFTLNEYRHLVITGQSWVASAVRPSTVWYRTVAYNFMLIMCNTGLRPSEAKGLRWRDITRAADHGGRELIVMAVRGRNKSRDVVAPLSVGKYLDRIRAISCATDADDPVFVTRTGEP